MMFLFTTSVMFCILIIIVLSPMIVKMAKEVREMEAAIEELINLMYLSHGNGNEDEIIETKILSFIGKKMLVANTLQEQEGNCNRLLSADRARKTIKYYQQRASSLTRCRSLLADLQNYADGLSDNHECFPRAATAFEDTIAVENVHLEIFGINNENWSVLKKKCAENKRRHLNKEGEMVDKLIASALSPTQPPDIAT